jgi:hypothetical protein
MISFWIEGLKAEIFVGSLQVLHIKDACVFQTVTCLISHCKHMLEVSQQ